MTNTSVRPGSVLSGESLSFPVRRDQDEPLELAERDLRTHLDRYGARPVTRGDAAERLLDTLTTIGLTGRGGAHFPVAEKWRSVRRAVAESGRTAVLVANAAEGEPLSAKDRALLVARPHLVLDGLFGTAEAVGADELVVWTHRGDTAHRHLAAAIEQRRGAGLDEPPVRLVSAPGRYLSGESSAIVSGLSGGPVLPRFRTVPAARSGVDGRPTLVHNVETLARIGLAARTGPRGYRTTTLLTVLTDRRLRVLESDPTWTVADAVQASGWTSWQDPQAVLLGGYGGTWLPWSTAAGLPVRESDLRAVGASLGAGIVAPLPAGVCPLAETADVVSWLAGSSARQCGPCEFGLPAIASIVDALAAGQATVADMKRLRQHLGEVEGRGGCHHPDGAVSFVSSALSVFAEHMGAHLSGQACRRREGRGVLPIPTQE
jgi:NADH:ubiquinone oxidoreductase subunit F (NADH-binding)